MNSTPLRPRRRTLWLALAAVLAVAGLSGLLARGAVADPVLAPLTPAELLNKVAAAHVDGLSATLEQRSDLGLPALPTGSLPNGDSLQSALTMLTGNHTFRVWTSGTDRARVAVVDGATETSVIRNGNQVWTWSSEKQEAGHATLTPGEKASPTATPLAPSEAITKFLAAVEPTTDVTTSGTGYVAGRAVYQLVLTPKDSASLVGQVRVSVDADTFVPLGARVIASDGSDAFTLAATSVDFSRPDPSVFDFTPPPGAKVTELTHPAGEPATPKGTKAKPTVHGTGWTAVAVTKVEAPQHDTMTALLKSLPEVSGAWGTGRLLQTTLVTVVFTDDGRVAAGAVSPERVYAALAER